MQNLQGIMFATVAARVAKAVISANEALPAECCKHTCFTASYNCAHSKSFCPGFNRNVFLRPEWDWCRAIVTPSSFFWPPAYSVLIWAELCAKCEKRASTRCSWGIVFCHHCEVAVSFGSDNKNLIGSSKRTFKIFRNSVLLRQKKAFLI